MWSYSRRESEWFLPMQASETGRDPALRQACRARSEIFARDFHESANLSSPSTCHQCRRSIWQVLQSATILRRAASLPSALPSCPATYMWRCLSVKHCQAAHQQFLVLYTNADLSKIPGLACPCRSYTHSGKCSEALSQTSMSV